MSQLYVLVAGPKRHSEFIRDHDSLEIVDRTETTLGGFFADPTAMPGRARDGGRVWSYRAVEREIEFALARQEDPIALRQPAPWDRSSKNAFPAIRRLQVTTPEILKTLPATLGARPGTRFLEGIISRLRQDSDPSVVALDPGGTLADWPGLTWLDRSTGAPVQVSTDPEDVGSVLLDTLDHRAIEWATRPPATPITAVTVNPHLVQLVGRVSGVIDAELDGLIEVKGKRPVHRQPDRLAAVQAEAKRLGKRAFMRRAGLSEGVAQRASTGRSISKRNVDLALAALCNTVPEPWCALDGCDRSVPRVGALYCSKAHRDRAYRRRRNPGVADPQNAYPTCPECGVVLLGAAVVGPCPFCSTTDNQRQGESP